MVCTAKSQPTRGSWGQRPLASRAPVTHCPLHPSRCGAGRAGEEELQEAPQGHGEEHRQSLCPLSGSRDPSPLTSAPSSGTGLSPSPVLGEMMSEEVVGCQLDGLLGGDKGQVHGSPCEARGGHRRIRGPGWGGTRPALASQLAKAWPSHSLAASCPLTHICARRGRGPGRDWEPLPLRALCLPCPHDPPTPAKWASPRTGGARGAGHCGWTQVKAGVRPAAGQSRGGRGEPL